VSIDKVQIYYLVLITMGLTLGFVPKEGTSLAQRLVTSVLGFIMSLPMVGRIFGWW
jgi:hypothetical protein